MQTLTEPGCDARSPETLAVRGISPASPKCQKFKCYESRAAAALDQLKTEGMNHTLIMTQDQIDIS